MYIYSNLNQFSRSGIIEAHIYDTARGKCLCNRTSGTDETEGFMPSMAGQRTIHLCEKCAKKAAKLGVKFQDVNANNVDYEAWFLDRRAVLCAQYDAIMRQAGATRTEAREKIANFIKQNLPAGFKFDQYLGIYLESPNSVYSLRVKTHKGEVELACNNVSIDSVLLPADYAFALGETATTPAADAPIIISFAKQLTAASSTSEDCSLRQE